MDGDRLKNRRHRMAKKSMKVKSRMCINIHFLVHIYSLKDSVTKTTVEYTQASSVHGIQYIFESGANLAVSKAIWVIFVAAAAGVGIFWSIEVSDISHL